MEDNTRSYFLVNKRNLTLHNRFAPLDGLEEDSINFEILENSDFCNVCNFECNNFDSDCNNNNNKDTPLINDIGYKTEHCHRY